MTAQNCYHCGLPVSKGDTYDVAIFGQPRPMCCPGCQSVAQTIIDIGMESYYEHRQQCEPGALPSADLIPSFLNTITDWDDPALQGTYTHALSEHQTEITLLITGITCSACVWLLENHLNQQPGITQFKVNMSNHRAQVIWNPTETSLSRVIQAIAKVGYKAEPYTPAQQEQTIRQENKRALTRVGLAGLGAMQVMTYAVGLYMGAFEGIDASHEQFLRWISALVCTPVYFYSGWPFLIGAWRSLKSAHLSMDVPVALALTFAYFSSLWATATHGPEVYFDSVSMFVFFLLVGRYLEMRARHRSQNTSIRLSHSQQQTARQLDDDDNPHLMPADKLKRGDRVLVKAGETIPGDGLILSGITAVNESMLTGEHLPLSKKTGDTVIGGTLNIEQPITINIACDSKDSTLSTLQRLLERAQADKPTTFLLADRIASHFVLAVLVISALVFAFWWQRSPEDAFWIMLSVLVVTCPCALSLATPTAITAATTALANLGFLSTRAHTIEALHSITDVVLDKTGTLTFGEFSLSQMIALNDWDVVEIQRLASVMESQSEHPIAKAFHKMPTPSLKEMGVSDICITPNQGIEAQKDGQTVRIGKAEFARFDHSIETPATPGQWLLMASQAQPIAWLKVDDECRPEAKTLINQLQIKGLHCHILTGDSSQHADDIANQLGIFNVTKNATPQDKLTYIQTLQSKGAIVLMIGDGLNDAPVLAGADVSIAVANATDLAKIAADGILLGNSLKPISAVLSCVNSTYRIIRQNLVWAILYNIVALPLAAAGFIPPWASALGMSASSLFVVLNARRIHQTQGAS